MNDGCKKHYGFSFHFKSSKLLKHLKVDDKRGSHSRSSEKLFNVHSKVRVAKYKPTFYIDTKENVSMPKMGKGKNNMSQGMVS